MSANQDTVECWQCGGIGILFGCFESCCVCDANGDPEECCSPQRCDICKGIGSYPRPEGHEE